MKPHITCLVVVDCVMLVFLFTLFVIVIRPGRIGLRDEPHFLAYTQALPSRGTRLRRTIVPKRQQGKYSRSERESEKEGTAVERRLNKKGTQTVLRERK